MTNGETIQAPLVLGGVNVRFIYYSREVEGGEEQAMLVMQVYPLPAGELTTGLATKLQEAAHAYLQEQKVAGEDVLDLGNLQGPTQ